MVQYKGKSIPWLKLIFRSKRSILGVLLIAGSIISFVQSGRGEVDQSAWDGHYYYIPGDKNYVADDLAMIFFASTLIVWGFVKNYKIYKNTTNETNS
jgi:hypothetical protein